jgi:hypothetical protein
MVWAGVAAVAIGYGALMVVIYQVVNNPEPVARHIGQIGRAVVDGFNSKPK